MQKIISMFMLASVMFIGIPAQASDVELVVPPTDTTVLLSVAPAVPPADTTELVEPAAAAIPPADTTELVDSSTPVIPPADTTDLSGSTSETPAIPPADITDLATPQPTTPSSPSTPNQGGGSSPIVIPGSQTGVSGFSSGFSVVTTSLPATQSVLGATTGPATGPACKAVITEYMKLGKVNSATEVAKLQVVLNAFMGKKLAVTGIFDAATDTALREFQQKYSKEILTPWVNAGLMEKAEPTGYAYITTIWFINNQLCGGGYPMPALK